VAARAKKPRGTARCMNARGGPFRALEVTQPFASSADASRDLAISCSTGTKRILMAHPFTSVPMGFSVVGTRTCGGEAAPGTPSQSRIYSTKSRRCSLPPAVPDARRWPGMREEPDRGTSAGSPSKPPNTPDPSV
jgi:hypothetical protein